MSRRTLYRDGNKAAQVHIDSAKILAQAEEYEAALDSLERAIERGYTATYWWPADSDLGALEGNPRFQELIERGAELRDTA